MPLLDKANKRHSFGIINGYEPRDIEQAYNEPAKLYCNEKWITTACLSCSDEWCLRYSDAEISCNDFPDFSYERNYNVCPVNALSWNYQQEQPVIDNSKCICCGLCALRCPAGAIYIKNNRVEISRTGSNISLMPVDGLQDNDTIRKHKRQILQMQKIAWRHHFQRENDKIMLNLYRKMSSVDGRSMIPNLFVRNLIIALGYRCAISRSGDVYTRMDAVYSPKGKWNEGKGAVEIEFGRDTLEASRGILDDIAVLHSRNGFDKSQNAALVVCLSFPNKRQGYFQVIKDVNKVLDLKIQTISLGALLILAWNEVPTSFGKYFFYVDFDDMSIRSKLEYLLQRRINLPAGFLGILEPEK